jgi:hypothetical protein
MAESVADALWSMLVSADCQLPAKRVALDNGALSSCASMRRPGLAVRHLVHPIPIGPGSQSRSASPGIRVSVPRTVRDAIAEFLAQPGPAPPDAVVDPSALRPPPTCRSARGFSARPRRGNGQRQLCDAIETMKPYLRLV